jgi:hypothetical protein
MSTSINVTFTDGVCSTYDVVAEPPNLFANLVRDALTPPSPVTLTLDHLLATRDRMYAEPPVMMTVEDYKAWRAGVEEHERWRREQG